jgi:PAS domain S-box-containing protein
MSRPDSLGWPKPSTRVSYGVAILSVATAVVAAQLFAELLHTDPIVSLFLCGIMFVAWFSGTGPAWLAAALSVVAFDYYIVSAANSFALAINDVPRVALFALAAVFVVLLSAAQRSAAESFRRSRDDLQVAVQKLEQTNTALQAESAERKRAEQDLQATIDTIPALVASYDPNGKRELLNHTARNYSGLSLAVVSSDKAWTAFHPDDDEAVNHEWRSCLATGKPFQMDVRLRRADGTYRCHLLRRVSLRDETGTIVKWYGEAFEIEAPKRVEQDVRRVDRNLQAPIDTIPDLAARYGPDGRRETINRIGRNYSSRSLAELTGRESLISVHPDDIETVDLAWRSSLAEGKPLQMEVRFWRADGEYRWHLLRRVPHRDELGNIVRWYGVAFDIEDQKRAEAALRQSEAYLAEVQRELRETIDTIPVLVATYRPNGLREFVNKTWQDYTGISLEEAQGKDWSITLHPDDLELGGRKWRACMESGELFLMEMRFRRADGEYRWHSVSRVPLRDARGEIVRWFSVSHDIEDQKRAEAALRENEARLSNAERELRLTLDWIPTLAWHTRPDGFAEYLNKRWLDYTGLSLQEALGWEWRTVIHPDDLPGLLEAWRQILGSGQRAEVEARMRRHDGEYRWFLFRPEPLRDESGKIVKWYGTNTDIEDRKRAEDALRRSEAYLTEAQRLSLTGTFGWKISPEEIYLSGETYRIFAYDGAIVPTMELLMRRVHPDDVGLVHQQLDRASQDGQDLDFEHRLLMPDGSVKHLRVVTRSTVDASNAREVIGAVMDITHAKRAQEALHEAHTELAHITRVTTLGQLSASIAHEVSQPLVGIVTNGDATLRWLEREAPDVEEARRAVRRIISDADRASNVIRRIRDLSKKVAPEMARLDINEVIRDAVMLVQRQALGDRVALRLELADGLPDVLGDRVQLQQVIINLVVNGIEAMASVSDRPRDLMVQSQGHQECQVLVAVRDAGVGIQPQMADRLFSAFYTTKPDGMGMGLSICRSIVEAHGGRVWATSNIGPGATIQFTVPQFQADERDGRHLSILPAQPSAAHNGS